MAIVDLASQSASIINRHAFAIDTLPECLEKEPNDSPGSAQQVTLPMIVNGRIDKGGDTGRVPFRRPGRERDRRGGLRAAIGSPLDSVLQADRRRRPATGVQRRPGGQGRGTGDAPRRFAPSASTLPADGTYYLHLGDAQHKGGPEYGYRLRISPPRPDFELRVVPSSINIRGGATIPLTVYALRKDGFAGDITLALKDAPPGYVLSGWVPGGQDKVQVTLTAPPSPTDEPITLSLEGRTADRGPRSRTSGCARRRHDAGLLLPAPRPGQRAQGRRLGPEDVQGRGEPSGRHACEESPRGGTATVRLGRDGAIAWEACSWR